MTQDPVAFRRATAVSLIGFLIQLVITLGLLVYGVLAGDGLAITGFAYCSTGLLVWVTLAVLFHQHRLERLEAIESEALAERGGAAASIFEESAEDLQVAARRLAWMHRYLAPGISLVVAVLLIGLGAIRLSSARALLANTGALSTMPGWAIAMGFLIAAIGFIFARFVAGMAVHEVWALLRGGASVAMGAAIVGALLGLGHAISFGGAHWLLRWLQVGAPGAMIVLGAEILLNYLLNMYRPRKSGEAPRPAFDSRVLSLLAAPDRIAETVSEAINYQFGFDVSATWFYQLLSKWTLALASLSAVTLWGLSAFVVVEPDERALILRSGALTREVGPGLHVKAPWPIGTVIRRPALGVNTLAIRQESIDPGAPIVWTKPHVAGQEQYVIVRASREETGGADIALLGAELVVEYEVVDLRAFQMLAADSTDRSDPDALRRGVLEALARREFMLEFGSRDVDEALGADRLDIITAIQNRLTRAFSSLNVDPQTGRPLGAGVHVLTVNVVGVHPPSEKQVGKAFYDVVEAQQHRSAGISAAQAQMIRTLTKTVGNVSLARRIVTELDQLEALTNQGAPVAAISAQERAVDALLSSAGGDAAALISKARADRWDTNMDAQAQAARQQGRTLSYHAAPYVYSAMLYLKTIRDAVKDARVLITTFDTSQVQFDFTEMQPDIDPFAIRKVQKQE